MNQLGFQRARHLPGAVAKIRHRSASIPVHSANTTMLVNRCVGVIREEFTVRGETAKVQGTHDPQTETGTWPCLAIRN